MTLRNHLKMCGWKASNLEGSLYNQRGQQELIKELISGCESGLEIGFNAGDSAELFLSQGCSLVSFDIGRHKYTYDGEEYLSNNYPNKLKLIIGDSTTTLPEHEGKYDFIYIDGGHTYNVCRQDIFNCKKFAHKDTIVMIDDYVSQEDLIRPHNTGVIRAVDEAQNNNLLIIDGQKDIGKGRGIIYGKYL